MVTIRKKYRIEMAHQLVGAFTDECNDTIHGHSYVVEVFIAGEVDHRGMVIDFGELDEVKREVMRWDHALLMPNMLPADYLTMLKKHNEKVIVVPWNPTAENLAVQLHDAISRCLLKFEVKVRVHETETGYAETEME